MELPRTVKECHDLIDQLLEENAALRQSGASFGRLAERLNTALQEQRRLAREGRVLGRSAGDRHPEPAEPAMAGFDRHNAAHTPRG